MWEQHRRPVWVRDLVAGLVVTAIAELELWLTASEVPDPLLWHVLMNLLILPALAVRRVSPLASAVVVAVSMALQPFVGPSPVATGFLVVLFLLASLGWYASVRHGLAGLGAVIAGGVVYDLTEELVPADLVVNVVLLTSAWAGGRAVRVASDRRVAAELAADRSARLAVQEERGRISRDLHDSLAHALTLITLQAGSGRERADDAGTAALLGNIESSARDSLTEMHRFLRLLDATPEEQPGIAHLDALVDGVRHSGLDVEVRIGVDDVPHGVSTAVYRVVQEGLTNVVRHSESHRAVVDVRCEGASLVTTVCSDGPAREAELPGSGRGLVGLRERLAVVGGTLESAPTAAGWRLEARIPLAGGLA